MPKGMFSWPSYIGAVVTLEVPITKVGLSAGLK